VQPPDQLPVGCKFQDRCPAVQERCREVEPRLAPAGPADEAAGRAVRCHFPLLGGTQA
jgi:ABC-type antimicrobial peptide transport system ATPase subunit